VVELLPLGNVKVVEVHLLLILVVNVVFVVLGGQLEMLPLDHRQ